MSDRSWHADGLCNGHPDPDLWHYDNVVWEDEQELQALRSVEAIQICTDCPVKSQCLKQGLEEENILSGLGGNGSIWGGYMTSERAKMMRVRDNHIAIWGERRHSKRVRQLLGKLVR